MMIRIQTQLGYERHELLGMAADTALSQMTKTYNPYPSYNAVCPNLPGKNTPGRADDEETY